MSLSTIRNIFLNFDSTDQISIELFIPFSVKRMIIKHILIFDTDFLDSGIMNCVTCDNTIPLGTNYNILINYNTDLTYQGNSEIEYNFQFPIEIKGTYNFYLRGFNGANVTNVIDDIDTMINLTVEFQS